MSKRPARNWGLFFGLGVPLLIAGGGAMFITFATLIDVAHLSGLPYPVFFPLVVDGGMIGCMVAATEFKRRGINGAWLAWIGFIGLSIVSVIANSMHARLTADLDVMPIWSVSIIGAIPSAVLLLMTRLVENMVPDEKERAKLQARREQTENPAVRKPVASPPARPAAPASSPSPAVPSAPAAKPEAAAAAGDQAAPLRLVNQPTPDKSEVRARVLEHHQETGAKPTGAEVGKWLGGKSAKTGQRFLAQLDAEGAFTEQGLVAVQGGYRP